MLKSNFTIPLQYTSALWFASPFGVCTLCTLPPIIMEGPLETKHMFQDPIFHFHDYGRKSSNFSKVFLGRHCCKQLSWLRGLEPNDQRGEDFWGTSGCPLSSLWQPQLRAASGLDGARLARNACRSCLCNTVKIMARIFFYLVVCGCERKKSLWLLTYSGHPCSWVADHTLYGFTWLRWLSMPRSVSLGSLRKMKALSIQLDGRVDGCVSILAWLVFVGYHPGSVQAGRLFRNTWCKWSPLTRLNRCDDHSCKPWHSFCWQLGCGLPKLRCKKCPSPVHPPGFLGFSATAATVTC